MVPKVTLNFTKVNYRILKRCWQTAWPPDTYGFPFGFWGFFCADVSGRDTAPFAAREPRCPATAFRFWHRGYRRGLPVAARRQRSGQLPTAGSRPESLPALPTNPRPGRKQKYLPCNRMFLRWATDVQPWSSSRRRAGFRGRLPTRVRRGTAEPGRGGRGSWGQRYVLQVSRWMGGRIQMRECCSSSGPGQPLNGVWSRRSEQGSQERKGSRSERYPHCKSHKSLCILTHPPTHPLQALNIEIIKTCINRRIYLELGGAAPRSIPAGRGAGGAPGGSGRAELRSPGTKAAYKPGLPRESLIRDRSPHSKQTDYRGNWSLIYMENDYLLQPISVKLTDRLPKIRSPHPPLRV